MKALLVAAGLFFLVFGGGLAYFALTGPGQGNNLKFVLPIDTRDMPKLGEPPQIVSQIPDDAASHVVDGRAEAVPLPVQPQAKLVSFPDRQGAASEAPAAQE